MLRKILFPIDFTPLSRKGLVWTVDNLADDDSEFVLAHVVDTSAGVNTPELLQEAEEILGSISDELSERNIRNSTIAEAGDTYEVLSDIAHREGCSFSVMFSEQGDVVAPLIRYLAIPHLVVKTRDEAMPPENLFSKIVVCTDLSPERTERTLTDLHALLGRSTGSITLLHAVPLDDTSSAEWLTQSAWEAAGEVRSMVSSWNPDVAIDVIGGEPETDLLNRVREIGPCLLVVGLSTHGELWQLIIGSTGEVLVENAPCPVLVLPA